jgi:hypothetical protein
MLPEARDQYTRRWTQISGQTSSPYSTLFPKEMQFELAFFRAGGLLLAGTDPTGYGGVVAGSSNHRELELLVAPRGELPPFAMTDAWGRRDVAGVLEASERLLARSPGPARDSLPRIVGLLTSHIARVAECQALAAEGATPRDAAEQLKKNRFYVEKLFEQAGNFTPDELRDAIVRLAELDLALKGGSRLAGELEFNRALVELTRPREAVAAR